MPIPDAASGKHITTCLYNIDRLAFTGTGARNAYIKFLPWLPCPLLLQGDAVLNSSAIPANDATYWAPGGVLKQLTGTTVAATSRPGSVLPNNFSAHKVRIASMGLRIQYTGPAQTCSGMIRVYDNDSALSEGSQTTSTSSTVTAPTTGIFLQQLTPTGTATAYANINTAVVDFDGVAIGSATTTTQSFRPEEGVAIRMKHRSSDFRQVELRQILVGVTPTTDTYATGAFLNLAGLICETNNYGGGLYGWDEDWAGIDIRFDNVNADASFSIETCVCLEVSPSSNSAFASLVAEDLLQLPLKALLAPDRILSAEGSAVSLDALNKAMNRAEAILAEDRSRHPNRGRPR